MSYRTPAAVARHEEVVGGSRFIAVVTPVDSVAAAEAQVRRARDEHRAATHHCWAYRVGDAMRFSDDGEPGGSAGRPMLEVILKRELDFCAAVVVRYYGGRKLGVGGLARAYGGAVAKALDLAGSREVFERERLEVRAPFADVDAVLRALPDALAAFDEDGLVAVVDVLSAERAALEERLAQITRGAASVRSLAE